MNRFGSESPAANALPHTRYMDPRLTAFLDRCVQLDLETGPGGALHKIGAIREGETFVREGRLDASRALAELDAFAAGCDYLLGHNLLGHDLPTLRAHAPVLELLSRPVVDTLYLSPLAFPENPYHRLVKDYKLVRDAVSDPVADARLATKEDVRLVVHLDIPGSLESYVQEAGRAGRDRKPALCVLLYDEQDVERQFRMEAMSELTRQDIAEILRGLRRAKRGKDDSVVLTSGELLRDEELRLGFDADDRQADTRVRVAVAWLERAGLVERNENRTRIFQGRPAVASLEDARRRIAPLRLSAAQEARWLAVLEALINADPDEGFTADELARLPVFKRIEAEQGAWDTGETAGLRVLRTLHDMTAAGLLHQGPQLSAFLRYKVQNGSEQILQHACELERAMLEALRLEAPDAETREWLPLSLPRLNQHLLDQGLDSNPETLRNLLASLARDGRGLAGERGSLELRQNDRDHYRVKLHRDWPALTATATTATPPTARVAAQRPGRCRWLRSACGPGNWACGSV